MYVLVSEDLTRSKRDALRFAASAEDDPHERAGFASTEAGALRHLASQFGMHLDDFVAQATIEYVEVR